MKYFLLGSLMLLFNLLMAQVTPLPQAHSHNDYEQAEPLKAALDNGFTSIEADVLYIYGRLFVGHNMPDSKTHNLKQLQRQYLKPLYKRFKKNGGYIYPNYEAPFYLWIDIKFEPTKTYRKLREILFAFREMLTYYENGVVHQGKVVVILSGERPFKELLNDPLQLMTLDGRPEDLAKKYPRYLMPFISENAAKIAGTEDYSKVGAIELQRVETYIEAVHAQEKKTRLWATPEEETLWTILLEMNIDLINTDDLPKLQRFLNGELKNGELRMKN